MRIQNLKSKIQNWHEDLMKFKNNWSRMTYRYFDCKPGDDVQKLININPWLNINQGVYFLLTNDIQHWYLGIFYIKLSPKSWNKSLH